MGVGSGGAGAAVVVVVVVGVVVVDSGAVVVVVVVAVLVAAVVLVAAGAAAVVTGAAAATTISTAPTAAATTEMGTRMRSSTHRCVLHALRTGTCRRIGASSRQVLGVERQTGGTPCLRQGRSICFVVETCRPFQMARRVSAGSITSSTLA